MDVTSAEGATGKRIRSMVKKIDITQHNLVPKFSKLSEEEKQKILDFYNISLVQLPAIFSKDPMVKAVEAKQNDIIKIERVSNLGRAPYYRRVVE